MRKVIQLFEYETLTLNQSIQGITFDQNMLTAFEAFYGEKGVPYYTLIRNGVKFNQYVGALQVGELLVEVLPKLDKPNIDQAQKKHWQASLIDMLRVSGILSFEAPSSSSLALKSNALLDVYFDLFLQEVSYLLHIGLVKQYRQTVGNSKVLKGSVQFAQHIQRNIVHQERFYVRHTVFDTAHTLHFILYKTIRLLQKINTNTDLDSKIGALLLKFPEMPDIPIYEDIFERLVFHRQTESYRKAIEIAKLLLLNYHPDLQAGKHHVLALMFDMNLLWEKFVYASLQKYRTQDITLACQVYKGFWKAENTHQVGIKPDIVIYRKNTKCVILDTKWKHLVAETAKPTPDDLRQMYVYQAYYQAEKVGLVYPATHRESITEGSYLPVVESQDTTEIVCSMLFLPTQNNITDWQKNIAQQIINWLPANQYF